jgi:hypothetical protein
MIDFLPEKDQHLGSVRASLRVVRPDELERRLQERLDALGLPHATNSSTSYVSPTSTAPNGLASSVCTRRRGASGTPDRLEEDKAARAVVFGLLAEMERKWPERGGAVGT